MEDVKTIKDNGHKIGPGKGVGNSFLSFPEALLKKENCPLNETWRGGRYIF